MKTLITKLAAGTFLAVFILGANVNTNASESNASSHEAKETKLELENWMTNENIWDTDSFYTADFTFEVEAEMDLEIENWMTNEMMWDANLLMEIEAETRLEVENWMTTEYNWVERITEEEKKLTLEAWMTDKKNWK